MKSTDLIIPKNLDEAIAFLESKLSSGDRQWLIDDNDPWIHHGFGMNLRNNWGLWQEGTVLRVWFEKRKVWHPDDMSGIILESFRRHMTGRPIELDEQIKHYQDYWKTAKEAEETGEPQEWSFTNAAGKVIRCVLHLCKKDDFKKQQSQIVALIIFNMVARFSGTILSTFIVSQVLTL